MSTFVLLHSPFDGPSVWSPVADLLRARRHRVALPDLRPTSADLASWDYLAPAVAAALAQAASPADSPLLLVAHGAAGLLAPAIGEAHARPIGAYLFLDADLPPDGPATLAAAVEARGDAGDQQRATGALEAAIPDPDRRAALLAERRPLPPALLRAPIQPPEDWDDPPCGYLGLGVDYAAPAEEARELGWAHAALAGGHYMPLADPGPLLLTLVLLCTRLGLDLSRR